MQGEIVARGAAAVNPWDKWQPLLSRLGEVALHLLIAACGVVMLLPLVWVVSTSLKLPGAAFEWPPNLIPNPVVWSNYVEVFNVVPFFMFARNTLLITVIAMIGSILSSTLVGFAFARLRFPGREVLFILCLSTMMLPLHRHPHPVIYPVPHPGLGRYLPAADRAGVVRIILLHLPLSPVLPHPSARVRRSGAHRRRRQLAHLVGDHPAQLSPTAGDDRHFLLQFVLE